MNTPQGVDMNAVISNMLNLAEAVIVDGVHHARADDPHRFASLPREFDDGKARRQLVIDYFPGGKVCIAQRLIGTYAGDEKVVELFATVVQAQGSGGDVAH